MLGDVIDHSAVDVDGAAVAQRLDVFGAGFAGRHGGFPMAHPKLIPPAMTKGPPQSETLPRINDLVVSGSRWQKRGVCSSIRRTVVCGERCVNPPEFEKR